jgi:hypothetical protein
MSLLDWNSIENSRHGIADSKKVPSKNNPSQWNRIECTCLDGAILYLEFTIEIESNKSNKAIRDRAFPIKVGKFSVKYHTF